MDKSQVCFRLYDFSLFSPILLWSSKRQDPFSYPFFLDECCQNYKLRMVAKLFVRFVDLHFVQCFSVTVLVVWFLKSLVKKKRTKRENCSFRYLNSVGDVYFGHSFLQQRLKIRASAYFWRSTGTSNCRFIFVSDHFL